MPFKKKSKRGRNFAISPMLILIWNEIRNLIGETASILIADSTAVKTDRLYRLSLIGCKRRKRKVVDKMNILAER